MRRGTKCVAQTINLSNPETCIRPKRIQKLVQAELMHPCPSVAAGSGTAYWTPRPVTVKICTRKDMQRTCPPKICECPQKVQRRTIGQKLCTALFFLLKSGIAAGLVYWTHSEGLWGSSADVEDLYRRIMATIMPALADKEIELPRISEFKYSLIQRYNRAVFTLMECIMSASAMLRKQLQNIMLAIEPPKDKPAEPESEAESSKVVITEVETESQDASQNGSRNGSQDASQDDTVEETT